MDQVLVGKIRTSHGVRGDLKVFSISGEYDHFKDFETVTLKKGRREKVFEVEGVRGAGPATLIKLKGIDTPEEGKLYAGYEIYVAEEFKAPCDDDEYYQDDLVGCIVEFEGKKMGEVINLMYGGPKDLLEIKLEDTDKVVLVPFRDEFVGDVNIANKTIQLRVDWILD